MSGKTLAEAGAAFQAAGRPLTLTFHVPSYEAAVWVDGSGLASAEKAEELCAPQPFCPLGCFLVTFGPSCARLSCCLAFRRQRWFKWARKC